MRLQLKLGILHKANALQLMGLSRQMGKQEALQVMTLHLEIGI